MTTKEELSYPIKNLDEESTEIVCQLVYKLTNENDLINEEGEVIVDEFYKKYYLILMKPTMAKTLPMKN